MSWVQGILPICLSLAALPAAAQDAKPLQIRHQPPGCLLPDRFSSLRAQISPIAQVLRARLLFRTDPAAEPHVVNMDQEGEEFVATLPKPLASLERVHYWIEAADPGLREVASDEYAVPVQAACADPAPARKKAPIDVIPPLGGGLVPVGFVDDPDAQVEPAKGSSRAGVFNLGPWASLGGALAVGGAATAVVLTRHNEGNPPARDPVMENPGVYFIESSPPPGSTVRLNQSLHVVIRLVAPQDMNVQVSVELRSSPSGPVCAILPTGGQSLKAFIGQNVVMNVQPSLTGACGSSFEVSSIRVQLLDFGGRMRYGTGTAEVPDLAVRYIFTP
jgi:hypothetical protein